MSAPSRRVLLNLVLAAVVLALGGLVAWLNLSPDATDTGLTPLSGEAVTDIRVKREGSPDLHLVKDGDRWKLTEPFEIAASPYRAGMLARLADEPSFADYAMDELDLARYGLSPGRAEVILDGEIHILFGDTNPLNRRRYVRVDDRVHLIDDKVFPVLQAPVASYVGPKLIPADAQLIALTLPGQRLMRSDAGWALDPPRPDVSADDVQTLVDAWKHAEALWANPLEQDDADAAAPVVTITLADGRSLGFELRRTDSDLILLRRDLGLAYTLPADQAASLLELKPSPPTGPDAPAHPGDS